jgi:EAL domain-containing protein (putative c-di-GMP-specific phosphodiesterase class I)
MPHTDGVAFWDPDKAELSLPTPLQLQADKLMEDAPFAYQDDERMAAVIPLRQWNDVSISVSMPLKDVPSGAGLKACTLLLSILGTLAVWASSTAAPVVRMRNRIAAFTSRMAHKLKLDAVQKNLTARTRHTQNEKPDLAWERKTTPTDTPEGVDFKDFGAVASKDSSSAEPRISDHTPADSPEKPTAPKKKKGWKASSSFTPTLSLPSTQADPEKPDINLEKADLKTIVETCIREGRIMLHYQPIFRMDDSMPVLHEVFARLIHPNGSLIMPGQFMPLIEHHSLSLELDLAVFRKVQTTHFNTSAGPLTPLALNISSTSLDGLDYMTEMSKQTPKILSKLAFEVRSQEMARDNRALKLIKQIQRHGGNLAVDYFGGGTSMIKASKEVGFDYIKLDMGTLLRKDPTGDDIKELCQAARSVGLPVILEKISDMDSEIVARKSGAPYIQGYSLAVPGPSLIISPLPPRMTGIAAIVNNTIAE